MNVLAFQKESLFKNQISCSDIGIAKIGLDQSQSFYKLWKNFFIIIYPKLIQKDNFFWCVYGYNFCNLKQTLGIFFFQEWARYKSLSEIYII